MSIFFQLMDIATGNLVTEFQSEDEAIEALSSIQADEGDQPILEFALFRFQDGHPSLVAKQGELIRYIAHARGRGLNYEARGSREPDSPTRKAHATRIA